MTPAWRPSPSGRVGSASPLSHSPRVPALPAGSQRRSPASPVPLALGPLLLPGCLPCPRCRGALPASVSLSLPGISQRARTDSNPNLLICRSTRGVDHYAPWITAGAQYGLWPGGPSKGLPVALPTSDHRMPPFPTVGSHVVLTPPLRFRATHPGATPEGPPQPRRPSESCSADRGSASCRRGHSQVSSRPGRMARLNESASCSKPRDLLALLDLRSRATLRVTDLAPPHSPKPHRSVIAPGRRFTPRLPGAGWSPTRGGTDMGRAAVGHSARLPGGR